MTVRAASMRPRPTVPSQRHDASQLWLPALRRYLVFVTVANLVWETVQLPLYTLWWQDTPARIAFAVLHCTGGDVLIATSSLVLALLLIGGGWPDDRRAFRNVAGLTIGLGVAYTMFSEWLNTKIRESWAYSEPMPVIPVIDVGLSPVAQWIVIPILGFWWTRRAIRSAVQREG